MRYYKTEAHMYILKLSRPNPSHEYEFSSYLLLPPKEVESQNKYHKYTEQNKPNKKSC